jgi:hypothetical protein
VALASRGLRDMDSGVQDISEDDVRAAVRKQAQQVQVKALLSGVAGTALTFLI